MADNQSDSGSLWENARGYASLLGQIPSSFTSTIRSLKADADKGQKASAGSLFLANRLASSPSMKVSLYFALKSYLPQVLDSKPMLTSKDIVRLWGPDELATFMGVSFLFRKAKKLAAEDEWVQYTKGIHGLVDLGVHVGFAIPKIGPAKGFLASCFDTVALTCFHLHDKKGFTEYRRTLKTKNLVQDIDYEMSRWGCSRYHIAAILIQTLGFGIPYSNSYAVGLLAEDELEKKLEPDAYTFRISKVWINSLERTGKQPDRAMRVDYYPETPQMESLSAHASEIRSSGSPFCWLDRGKDDLSPSSTPHLIEEAKSVKAEDIPDELKGKISEKDLEVVDEE